MNLKLIILSSLFLVMVSCKNHDKAKTKLDCPTITVNLEDIEDLDYQRTFSTINLIPLETSDSILVGRLSGKQAFYVHDKYYTIISKANTTIVDVFDLNGKHISSSSKRIGKGPEEYHLLQDVIYNQEKNTFDILTYDQSIISYDSNFDFVSRVKINAKANDAFRTMYALHKQQYLLFNQIDKGSIILYDTDKGVQVKKILYPGLINEASGVYEPFTTSNEILYFTPPEANDFIFTYNKEKMDLTSRYQLDAGELSINANELERFNSAKERGNYIINESNKYSLYRRLQNEKYIVSTYIRKQEIVISVLNLQTNSSHTFKRFKNSEHMLPLFFAIDGDNLLAVVPASGINNYIDTDLVEDKTSLQAIDTDDNPIIIRYQLK